MRRSISQIADDFFSYLGKHLPQQCASDEFFFLPRSENAIQYLSDLDDLTPEKIQHHIRHVQDLLYEIPMEKMGDIEEEIDRVFLSQSMKSFIREFEDAEGWKNDPTLYIKIPLFASNEIISQTNRNKNELKENLFTLFKQIPTFLNIAHKNLHSPSEISLQVAQNMIQDALQFFKHTIQIFIEQKAGKDKYLISENANVLKAWEEYKKALRRLRPKKSFSIGKNRLKNILTSSLNYLRSLEEIQEIIRQGYQKTQDELNSSATRIDNGKSWDQILYERPFSVASQKEVLQMYKKEVQDLRRFFYSRDMITWPSGEEVIVQKTPSYLQSWRATASYKPPLTGSDGDRGTFYINPGKEGLGRISTHCPYLCAHETYPGHHILDHIRIHHPNPIRRQIESPLFYEGWACYAEQLLDELGYIRDPRQKIVGLKRQLWRCLRALLDIELQTGKMSLNEGAKMLEALGFSTDTAKRQIRRFALSPGYQLCYFMGTYEILRLRKVFSSRLDKKAFHDTLLNGGQIPFHLVEKRMDIRATIWTPHTS